MLKNKRKLSRSIDKTLSGAKKAVKSRTKIYSKKNNQLVEIEEAKPNLEITQNFSKKSNIKVAVRLRPLGDKEIEDDQFEIVNIVENKVRIFH